MKTRTRTWRDETHPAHVGARKQIKKSCSRLDGYAAKPASLRVLVFWCHAINIPIHIGRTT
jgi:hypothetical protein